MTNAEKYKDELLEIIKIGKNFAVEKESGKLIPCYRLLCNDCLLKGSNCVRKKLEWLLAEYEEPKINIPPDTPIDTKVLVSDDGVVWNKRHYAGCINGKYWTWGYDRTSWSAYDKTSMFSWKYMRLAEEEEVNKND